MRLSQRQGLLGGLVLLACAGAALPILFARLATVLFGPHLALIAASTALLGGAAGAVLVAVVPALARPPRLFSRLAHLSCATSALTIIAMIAAVQPRWTEGAPAISAARVAVLFGVFALPFLFLGAAFAAAVRHAALDVSRASFAALFGSALGVFLALAALPIGVPRAGLVMAIVASLSAVCFLIAGVSSPSGPYSNAERPPFSGVVATFALGSIVLLAGDIGAPWLKLPHLRFMRVDKVELQRWSERALITVERPAGGAAQLNVDATALSPILDIKKAPDLSPSDLAYVLHKDRGPALVIGPGGGADVRRALKAGQKQIHTVEPDRVIANDIVSGKYREFNGDIYGRPEVSLAIAEARTYIRSAGDPFQSIVVSLPDSSAAAALGVLSLTPSWLHTIEGIRELFDHLAPTGTLLVSRSEPEIDRLFSLAAASLWSAGVVAPKDHIYACGQDRVTSLLIKRSPLTKEEITALRSFCKKSRFQEAFAPDVSKDSLRRRLVMTPDVDVAAPQHATDLAAPTDDRPFFSYITPARIFWKALRDPRSLVPASQGALAVLMLVAAAVAFALFFILVPLVSRPSLFLVAEGRAARARSLLFFMSIGSGAVFIGAALVQGATSLIQHPAYGLAAALLTLLIAGSLGALFTESTASVKVALSAGRRAQILVVIAAAYAAFSGPLFRLGLHLPLAGRLGVAVVLVAPAALLLGSLFPLGAKIVAGRSPELLPWCIGLQRAAAFVALGVGLLVALHAGFSALFLAAGFAYVVAAITVPIVAPPPVMYLPVSAPIPDLSLDFSPPPASPPASPVASPVASPLASPPAPPVASPELPPGFGAPPVAPPLADDAPPTVRGLGASRAEPSSSLPATRPSAGATSSDGPEGSGSST